MNNKKKMLLFLIGVSIIALVFVIVQIYAKYLTEASGDATMQIAHWNIKVNNLSIQDGSDISGVIVPVFPGNSNIAADIIAPTAEGYFDLNFDFTDTDVSFTYEITTEVSPDSSVSDLVATGYSVDSGSTVTFTNYNDPISDTILLTDNITTRSIRIFVKWDDDPTTQQMSNADDTASTSSVDSPLFTVNISFTQEAS